MRDASLPNKHATVWLARNPPAVYVVKLHHLHSMIGIRDFLKMMSESHSWSRRHNLYQPHKSRHWHGRDVVDGGRSAQMSRGNAAD